MNLVGAFTSVVAALALIGCASSKEMTQTNAPDGFYVETSEVSDSYKLQVVPPSGGRALRFHIRHYTAFVPQRVIVFDAPDGNHVQVDGKATAHEWSKEAIIIVANGKPYFELGKSGQAVSEGGVRFGPSATVALVLSTREEAESVASALRRRYSLSP